MTCSMILLEYFMNFFYLPYFKGQMRCAMRIRIRKDRILILYRILNSGSIKRDLSAFWNSWSMVFIPPCGRVQQVHEKWVNIRTLLQTKLINILNIHTNPDFKFLAECTEWVSQKLVSPHPLRLTLTLLFQSQTAVRPLGNG